MLGELTNLAQSLFVLTVPTAILILMTAFIVCGKKASEKLYTRITLAALTVQGVVSSFLLSLAIFSASAISEKISALFGCHFVITTYGLLFTILSVFLCYVTARFSVQYLHREQGFGRFYIFLLIFCYGMLVAVNTSSIEGTYIGWEFVGLTSFLLISFFFEREKSVDRAIRILAWYKLADFFILIAIASGFAANGNSLYGQISELSFCIAILIKSAQLPFSYWLPWALEGPSPSSAVFYGGLGIHLGVVALLTYCLSFDLSLTSQLMLSISAISTLLVSSYCQKLQSDAKSIIVFGVIAQISIIIIEILLGFYILAVAHIIGHALLRTYQILTVGGIIHDHPMSKWKGFYSFSLPKISGTRFAHWLIKESSKEVHYIHAILLLITKLSLQSERFFRSVKQRLSQIILFLLLNIFAVTIYFTNASSSFLIEATSLFFLILALLVAFSGRGIARLPLAFVFFHISLIFLHRSLSNEVFAWKFLSAEVATGTVAFLGLLYSTHCIVKRFGSTFSDHCSGLAQVLPATAFCVFVSILSLSGFPGTLGALSESILVHELSYRPHWIIILPLAYVLIGWSAYFRYVETFYGRCSVYTPEHFVHNRREKFFLYSISILSILLASASQFFINRF